MGLLYYIGLYRVYSGYAPTYIDIYLYRSVMDKKMETTIIRK